MVAQQSLTANLPVQISSACFTIAFGYSWLFATDYESVTYFEDLAVQLESRLRCGLGSYSCLFVEQVLDVLICEVTLFDIICAAVCC